MGPGATYAAVTFLAGVLVLLAWLYANAGNPRAGILLGKSFLLFGIPTILSPYPELFQFPLGMWVWVACEEGLKAFGATREEKREDKFWLVVLFGIWELTVDKPLWGLAVAQSGETWDRLGIAGLVYVTALPVLMHAVTAATYAFAFDRRLWAAFVAAWVVHTMFNEVVTYFAFVPTAVILETLVLAALLIFILKRRPLPAAPEERDR